MRIMKLICLCCIVVSAYSQNNSGEIIYESKMDIHKNLPPEAMAFKDNIPQFRTSHSKLVFTAEESMLSHHKDEKAEAKSGDFDNRRRRGRMMRMGGDRTKDVTYKNHTTGEQLRSRNIFDRLFLVEGTEEQEWKFTGEQKQVGSYLCQKAILQDSVETFVWFTPMIPVSVGPRGYSGLPGAILYVDEDNGTRIITAIDVQLKAIESDVIKKPTEGKKMTQDEFNKLREEKMEERIKEFGGSGNRRVFRSGR